MMKKKMKLFKHRRTGWMAVAGNVRIARNYIRYCDASDLVECGPRSKHKMQCGNDDENLYWWTAANIIEHFGAGPIPQAN